jgi:hypothetical protein
MMIKGGQDAAILNGHSLIEVNQLIMQTPPFLKLPSLLSAAPKNRVQAFVLPTR